MSLGALARLRRRYHRRLFRDVLRLSDGKPNNADKGGTSSVRIAKRVIEEIGIPVQRGRLAGQTAGSQFEEATKDFLSDALAIIAVPQSGEK